MTTAGTTINRFCSSGLQAISVAAERIIAGGVPIMVAGGLEQISLVARSANQSNRDEAWLKEHVPTLHMPMIDTAEVVAKRYGVGREAQDEYSLISQQRTAAGQKAGRFDAEIVPLAAEMEIEDKSTGEKRLETRTLAKDEGNRPDTSAAGLAKLEPVRGAGFTITAGNASQLSDGASACVLMERKLAEQRGLDILGLYRGMAVAGCEPDEMGIGPVFAVPRLLGRDGLAVDDIDLWELNEAFAVQVIYCRDRLGIPMERLNVDGGSISIGHPFGMSGSPHDGPRRSSKASAAAPATPSSPCASAAARAWPGCSRSAERYGAYAPFRSGGPSCVMEIGCTPKHLTRPAGNLERVGTVFIV